MILRRKIYDVKNKKVLITGSTGGLGKALTEIFISRGAKVIATSKSEKKLYDLSKEYEVYDYITCDLRSLDEIDRLADELEAKQYRLDILVNNAGVGVRKPFIEHSKEEIESILDVNLKGLIYLTYVILRRNINNIPFIIYNISSGAGLSGIEELTVYSASKFGVVGFTEALHRELNKFGIRVYALCPGGIDTEMHRKWFPEHRSFMLLNPRDVAERIVYNIEHDIGRGRCISISKIV